MRVIWGHLRGCLPQTAPKSPPVPKPELIISVTLREMTKLGSCLSPASVSPSSTVGTHSSGYCARPLPWYVRVAKRMIAQQRCRVMAARTRRCFPALLSRHPNEGRVLRFVRCDGGVPGHFQTWSMRTLQHNPSDSLPRPLARCQRPG